MLDRDGNPTGVFHTAGSYKDGYGDMVGLAGTVEGAVWDDQNDRDYWTNQEYDYIRSITLNNPVPVEHLGWNHFYDTCATYARDVWYDYTGEYIRLLPFLHLPSYLQGGLEQSDKMKRDYKSWLDEHYMYDLNPGY